MKEQSPRRMEVRTVLSAFDNRSGAFSSSVGSDIAHPENMGSNIHALFNANYNPAEFEAVVRAALPNCPVAAVDLLLPAIVDLRNFYRADLDTHPHARFLLSYREQHIRELQLMVKLENQPQILMLLVNFFVRSAETTMNVFRGTL